MHRLWVIALFASMTMVWGTTCNAQYIPQGSYQQTCQDVQVRGDDLLAHCQTRDGDLRETMLDRYNWCRGDISNDNGQLRCVEEQYGEGGYGAGPRGSYLQTCQDVQVRGDDLIARCRERDGDLRETRLDHFQWCRGDINNDDGRLRCTGVYQQGGYRAGPEGSYRQTCRYAQVQGDDLIARCQERDGDWRDARLDHYQWCRGDITNQDGQLRCVGQYQRPGYGGAGGPGGSYQQTCRDIRVSGDDLRARCQTRGGGWRDSKLDDYNDCRGDITNEDGRLRCVAVAAPPYDRRPGYGQRTPDGSYQQSCTDINVRGDDLRARCRTASGNYRDTSLDKFRQCRGDIMNDDGHLRCNR